MPSDSSQASLFASGTVCVQSDRTWYEGTADAVYQNLNLIDEADDQVVAVFGADHVYRMDIHQMLQFHEQKGVEVTVAAVPIQANLASEFGVVETDYPG